MGRCPNCQTEVSADATVCPRCQTELILQAVEVTGPSPYVAPKPLSFEIAGQDEGDATGGLIPYKNPKALVAYYLGILSGLPLIGLPIGIAAFVLGIQGLRDRKRNPVIKGSVHAGIGIGCGLVFSLVWTAVIVIIVIFLIGSSME